MRSVRIRAAALAALLLALCCAAYAEYLPAEALYLLTEDPPVYADALMETLLGVLSAGQAVYAEEWNGEGNARIVFIYPLLLRDGWIRPETAVLLEGEALEEYLLTAAEDGMRYKTEPLLPAVFSPAGDGAPEGEDAGRDEGPSFIPAILRQPGDQAGRVGQTVTFTVEAENVASYRWQFHNGRVWKDCTMKGWDGPAMEVEVSQKRFSYMYRCILTFEDGTVLFSDEARIVQR